jgi:tetratricopeptide (TPR) repeat protein
MSRLLVCHNHAQSLAGLKHLIETGWLVLAASLPAFFSPWNRNPFELPKALLLWAVIAIMGATWLAGRFGCDERDPPVAADHVRHILRLAVPAFGVVLIVTTLFSVNPLTSAQGSYERMQGLITWLCYLTLFLLVTTQLREAAQAERLLTALAWGSAPVVLYGLLQWLRFDPLDWHAEESPISSTLGRSNFVSAYLVIVIPITLQRAWQARERIKRAACILLIVAQFICLAAADSRAAWLGILAEGSVLGLATIWNHGRRRLVQIGLAIGTAVMLVGPMALMLISNAQGSIGARATIWRSTLPLVADQPILGHGLETFGQVFTGVSPPELVYWQGRAVYVDRAHNLMLDTLASVGVTGLIVYVGVIGAALAIGARAFARARDRAQRFVLLAGLAAVGGHLAETQFSFEVTTTAALFWMLLGMLVAPWVNRSSTSMTSALTRKTSWSLKLLGVVLLLTVLPVSALLFVADVNAGDANQLGTPAELNHSIAAMQQAAALWPDQSAYHLHLSWLYLQQAQSNQDAPGAFRAAESELDTARSLTPGDYRAWAAYGELYAAWARARDGSRFVQSEEAYRQATRLFPGSAMLHTGWGLLYVDQGRWSEAADQFQQAVALDNTDAWAYLYLGDALSTQGNSVGAEWAYLQSLHWAPGLVDAYRGLGRIYRDRGEIELALLAYQRAVEITPDDPDLQLDLALAYQAAGQFDAACASAEHGAIIAPDHVGLRTFLAGCIQ